MPLPPFPSSHPDAYTITGEGKLTWAYPTTNDKVRVGAIHCCGHRATAVYGSDPGAEIIRIDVPLLTAPMMNFSGARQRLSDSDGTAYVIRNVEEDDSFTWAKVIAVREDVHAKAMDELAHAKIQHIRRLEAMNPSLKQERDDDLDEEDDPQCISAMIRALFEKIPRRYDVAVLNGRRVDPTEWWDAYGRDAYNRDMLNECMDAEAPSEREAESCRATAA